MKARFPIRGESLRLCCVAALTACAAASSVSCNPCQCRAVNANATRTGGGATASSSASPSVHYDWKNSRPMDLSDHGLMADLGERGSEIVSEA